VKILQVGPESSGGKLVGPWMRDNGHTVLRLSFPYGHRDYNRRWPVAEAHHWCAEHPDGPIIVTLRGFMFATQSQVAVPHVEDMAEARRSTREAMLRIFGFLNGVDNPWYPVVYEALVNYPETVTEGLSEFLGVPLEPPRVLYDANQKWRAA